MRVLAIFSLYLPIVFIKCDSATLYLPIYHDPILNNRATAAAATHCDAEKKLFIVTDSESELCKNAFQTRHLYYRTSYYIVIERV